jgi:hypothetical protein
VRDNHVGMPEFIDAFEKDGQYFGVIAAIDGDKERRFQFALSLQGYRALRKVMQDRPFDLMPGLRYRYFYAGSSKRSPAERYTMSVRIQLERDARQKEFDIPKDLHANLLWFTLLESLEAAEHLEIGKK